MQETNTNSFPNEPTKPAVPKPTPAAAENFKPDKTGTQPFSGTVQRTSSSPVVGTGNTAALPKKEEVKPTEKTGEEKSMDNNQESEKKGTELMVTDRTHYESNMESRLSDLGAKIDDFVEKAGNAKDQVACTLKELNEKREHAMTKFQCLKDTSCEAFGEFKTGMDKAFEDLSKAWEEIKVGSSKAASKFEK